MIRAPALQVRRGERLPQTELNHIKDPAAELHHKRAEDQHGGGQPAGCDRHHRPGADQHQHRPPSIDRPGPQRWLSAGDIAAATTKPALPAAKPNPIARRSETALLGQEENQHRYACVVPNVPQSVADRGDAQDRIAEDEPQPFVNRRAMTRSGEATRPRLGRSDRRQAGGGKEKRGTADEEGDWRAGDANQHPRQAASGDAGEAFAQKDLANWRRRPALARPVMGDGPATQARTRPISCRPRTRRRRQSRSSSAFAWPRPIRRAGRPPARSRSRS